MTRYSSPTRTFPLDLKLFTSSTPRNFHFMMHLPSYYEFPNLHLIKPKITLSTYYSTLSTYLDPTLLFSTAFSSMTAELQQSTIHEVPLINFHKSSLTLNQITHKLVTTPAIHPQNFPLSEVIVTPTFQKKSFHVPRLHNHLLI